MKAESAADFKPGLNGFRPLKKAISDSDRAVVVEAVARFKTRPEQSLSRAGFIPAMERMIANLRARDITPVYFVSPNLELIALPWWPRRSPWAFPFCALMILFNTPLCEPENRADPMHLNAAGAEIFTELLARQFADQFSKELVFHAAIR